MALFPGYFCLCVQVEKRHANSLSFSEFFFRYALTHTPVVITGLVGHMTLTPWTLDYIKKVCHHTNTHGTVTAIQVCNRSVSYIGDFDPNQCTTQLIKLFSIYEDIYIFAPCDYIQDTSNIETLGSPELSIEHMAFKHCCFSNILYIPSM